MHLHKTTNDHVLQESLRKGANINTVRPPEQKTALHFVAHVGISEAAMLLLERKAVVDARDSEMRTALHSKCITECSH